MIENLQERENLVAVARRAAKKSEERTIRVTEMDQFLSSGWELIRTGKHSVRVRRPKRMGVALEDSVWLLLYKLGFGHLSVGNRARLLLNGNGDSPYYQLDGVAVDDEIAVIVEAKSQESLSKRSQLRDELAKLESLKGRITQALNQQLPSAVKRITLFVMVLQNIVLTESDRERAKELNILLLDQDDVEYYALLSNRIGMAAKYQFLSDLVPGRKIPGLEVKVPAVKSKMGGFVCYTFPVAPEYLVKIAYVSHRAKGRGSDLGAYQRMISRERIRHIQEYISNGGMFPTNIVVNLEKRGSAIQFDRGQQVEGAEGGVFGWLTLRPAYRTAWIIDGQHRVFAYAGHPLAGKAIVTVMAFEGLPPSKQAELFIDINSKQKSVPRSLLEELYSDLRKDASSEVERARAVLSRAVLFLDRESDSSFAGRIKKSDESKDHKRCITLTAMLDALDKPGILSIKNQGDRILVPGALWVGDPDESLLRIIAVLKFWFQAIASRTSEWWNMGSSDGGGLSMNNGVTVCINVMRSVFEVLEKRGLRLATLSVQELCDVLRPYAVALGDNFAGFDLDERRRFRGLQGVTGQTTGTRRCQAAIAERIPEFSPDGLEDFLELERRQTNKRAKELIDEIEIRLQSVITSGLKECFGSEEEGWWFQGVPNAVREKVDKRRNEDKASRGGREFYFDLIDYSTIATQPENWEFFKDDIGFGAGQGKKAQTSWLDEVNEIRKIVAHASSGKTVTVEQLDRVEEIHGWFIAKEGFGIALE